MPQKANTNVEVTLRNVRLSFESVFTARVRKNKDGTASKPTYQASFLIPKKDAKQIDKIYDAIDECKVLMWGKNPPKIKPDNVQFKNGDAEEIDYDGYAGCMYVSARSPKAPKVVHSKKDAEGRFVVLEESDGVIYSGCMVNAIVRFWAQDDAEYGKRINCSLEVVQFYADNEAFSGHSPVDPDEKLAGLEGPVENNEEFGRNRGRSSRAEEDEPPARRSSRAEEDDGDLIPGRGRRE